MTYTIIVALLSVVVSVKKLFKMVTRRHWQFFLRSGYYCSHIHIAHVHLRRKKQFLLSLLNKNSINIFLNICNMTFLNIIFLWKEVLFLVGNIISLPSKHFINLIAWTQIVLCHNALRELEIATSSLDVEMGENILLSKSGVIFLLVSEKKRGKSSHQNDKCKLFKNVRILLLLMLLLLWYPPLAHKTSLLIFTRVCYLWRSYIQKTSIQSIKREGKFPLLFLTITLITCEIKWITKVERSVWKQLFYT